MLADGIEAILAICRNCAQAILGEMMFAKNQGMPYFETVGRRADHGTFEAAFRERISQVTGVTGIEELTTAQVGDKMEYSAIINTIYGREP